MKLFPGLEQSVMWEGLLLQFTLNWSTNSSACSFAPYHFQRDQRENMKRAGVTAGDRGSFQLVCMQRSRFELGQEAAVKVVENIQLFSIFCNRKESGLLEGCSCFIQLLTCELLPDPHLPGSEPDPGPLKGKVREAQKSFACEMLANGQRGVSIVLVS